MMSLFKYMGVAGAKGFLEKLSVRFTQPKAYNDPFEMAPVFYSNKLISKGSNLNFGITLAGYNPDLESFLVNDRPEFEFLLGHNLLDQINNIIGVTCFTYSEDRIPTNILMWAHYADSHRGIAVQFKDGVMGDELLNKVHYLLERPFLDASMLIRSDELHVSDLFFKSEHWEYEQEFRLIRGLEQCQKLKCQDNAGHDIYLSNLDVETIDKIFVGVNAPDEVKKLAEKFYQNYGITVVYQQLAKNSFHLVTELILTSKESDVKKCKVEYNDVEWRVLVPG